MTGATRNANTAGARRVVIKELNTVSEQLTS